jgi:hypothetical protein
MSDLAPHEFVSSWYGIALLLVAIVNSGACALEIAFAGECVRDLEPGSSFELPLHEAFFGA